jgi:transposase
MLSPEIQTEILSLHFSKRKGTRAIARELGINRNSVRRVIERRSVRLERQAPKRSSRLDPYKERVNELLKEDPQTTATVIMQRIRDEGFDGGCSIVREFVRKQRDQLRTQINEAFFKMEFFPGEAAQVDW